MPFFYLYPHDTLDYQFFYDGKLIIYTEASPDAMQILRVEQGKYTQKTFCNEREIKSIEGLTGTSLNKAFVITPFIKQGEALRKHFHCGKNICGTIHTFQGRGQETIFFSTVLNHLPFADIHLSGSHCLLNQ